MIAEAEHRAITGMGCEASQRMVVVQYDAEDLRKEERRKL